MFNQKFRKNYIIVLSVFAVLIFFAAGCGEKKPDGKVEDKTEKKSETQVPHENIVHADVQLPSIQCSMCKKTITKALKNTEGISSFDIDVKGKKMHVNFDKTKTDMSKIEKTITGAGYDANDKKSDPDAYNNLDDCCKLPKDKKDKSDH